MKFIEISSIGVSKESQLRAAMILGNLTDQRYDSANNFFLFGQAILNLRWKKLREVVEKSKIFTLPEYPLEFCKFSDTYTRANPGKFHYTNEHR